MKNKLLLNIVSVVTLLFFSNTSFGQAPSLGTAANYVIFTSGGAIANTGVTHVTGNMGTNAGAVTGYGNVDGVINVGNAAALQSSADLTAACTQIDATATTATHGAILGSSEILTAVSTL